MRRSVTILAAVTVVGTGVPAPATAAVDGLLVTRPRRRLLAG